MATPVNEDEHKVLKQQNAELVQKVQYWKMLAGQRENEKLDLLKELNEMRLQLARIRNKGNMLATKLDAAVESACKKALSNLVKASGEIASTMDITKAYMRDRTEDLCPRWSAVGGTPRGEKVHRVPPMNIGGQSIQPVVSLSRTPLNTSHMRSEVRSPNQNRNVTERAVPMHMLQDVYIPLTRIDAGDLRSSIPMDTEGNNSDDSDELELDVSNERIEITEESQRMSDDEVDEDDYTESRLDAVIEDLEPEEEPTTPRNSRADNPLEGPSWLLDAPRSSNKSLSQSGNKLEADSTTEVEEVPAVNPDTNNELDSVAPSAVCTPCAFTPTVRRRRRTSTPPPALYSPRPELKHRNSNSGRVLKVMVAKMRLDDVCPGTPAKRALPGACDAPSPHGATVAGVIVSEATEDALDLGASGEPHRKRRDARRPSKLGDSGRASTESRRSSHDSRQPSHDTRRPSHDSRQPSHDSRQPNHDSRQLGHDSRQPNHDSRQLNHDSRQLSHDTRQNDLDLRQLGHDSRQPNHDSTEPSHDSRQPSHDSKPPNHDSRQQNHDSRQQNHDSRQPSHDSKQTGHGSRQLGHDSRQSSQDQESSLDESEEEVSMRHDRNIRSTSRRSRRNDSRADVRYGSHDSLDSDSGEGRSRRARNRVVNYQEKPLNRKMRR